MVFSLKLSICILFHQQLYGMMTCILYMTIERRFVYVIEWEC